MRASARPVDTGAAPMKSALSVEGHQSSRVACTCGLRATSRTNWLVRPVMC
jgi:hypothetical protein